MNNPQHNQALLSDYTGRVYTQMQPQQNMYNNTNLDSNNFTNSANFNLNENNYNNPSLVQGINWNDYANSSPLSEGSTDSSNLSACTDLTDDDLLRILQSPTVSSDIDAGGNSGSLLGSSPPLHGQSPPTDNFLLNSQNTIVENSFIPNSVSGSPPQNAFPMSSVIANHNSPVNETNSPAAPVNSPGLTNFPVTLEYKVFPDIVPKHQRRVKGKSEQRVKNGNLSFVLDFQDPITFQLVQSIQVYVKRTNEVSGTPQFLGAVEIQSKWEAADGVRSLVHADLDSVYEHNGKKVYELQKTLTVELNKYHLIIAVQLKDGRFTHLKTKEFLLLGKETNPIPKPPDGKRARTDSNANNNIFNFSAPPSTSPVSGYGSDQESEIIRARRIVAEHVKTKSMEIDGVLISNKIESPNGDIAYHFTLQDSNDFFEEGEVVGLHTDVTENKQKLIKLTSRNAGEAMLKGVITRSQYFEAMKPPPGVKSETICMMGIVPVKVHGKVNPNDPLYASPRVPGAAVSALYLSEDEMRTACVVGYAFQMRAPRDEDSIGVVQAGVSVLSSVTNTLLSARLVCIEQEWERRLEKLMKKNLNFRKGLQLTGVATIVFIVFLGILLWQLLLPGSAYRYYECKRGALPGRTSSYVLARGIPVFDNFTVHGIEFQFNQLVKKIGSSSYLMREANDTRYYLNVDRCAFGGERSTKDSVGGKRVGGQLIFAVNGKCSEVYTYYELDRKWKRTKEISTKENEITVDKLRCVP